MRLNQREIDTIVTTLQPVLSTLKAPQLWLFGSQLDDTVRGGDVDLLVVADDAPSRMRDQLLGWASELEEVLEMPVDLVIHSRQRPPSAVARQALETGVRLL